MEDILEQDMPMLRRAVRNFLEKEVVGNCGRWRTQGYVDREVWIKAGALGFLCPALPEELGGAGGDFRHEVVIIEELVRIGFLDFAIPLHSGIVAPYILKYGNRDQRSRWLPGMASGELIGAIAMTEPGTGSDLRAIKTTATRTKGGYILNGQKTFISNGQLADLIVVVARAVDPVEGLTLFIVETKSAAGFTRGSNLGKIGLKAQDTSELFFDEVFVSENQLLGASTGGGMAQLMDQLPQERLIIAVQSVAGMEAAIQDAVEYTKYRTAFGKRLIEFQNTRFVLAQAKTDAAAGRAFVDQCIEKHLSGKLDAATAAMAKLWASEKQCEICDKCLQLFGGYGYMSEQTIANRWTDARVQTIYGGTSEIMKEIIARSL